MQQIRITVNATEFKSAIEKISKVAAIKSYMQPLMNTCLTTDGDSLRISATNLEQYAEAKIGAHTESPAAFIFSDTKTLLKGMRFFTGDTVVLEYTPSKTVEKSNGNGKQCTVPGEVIVSCGGKTMKQQTFEASEFPEFPILEKKLLNHFEYCNKKLKERFTAISYAAATTSEKPVLQGICFRESDMVALDDYRIAINKDNNLSVNKPFVVPCAAIKLVNDIMSRQLRMSTDEEYIQFIDELAGITLTSRLRRGEYLDYSKHVQNRGQTEIIVDVKDFTNALKYLKAFRTKNEAVHWYNRKMALDSDKGSFESEIEADGDMEFEIALNADHMLEGLSQFKGNVTIYLNTCFSPMVILGSDETNQAVVVPVYSKKRLFAP